MKCAICQHGPTEIGATTVIFEHEDTTLVFKQVPAESCINCGEEYISAEVNSTLLSVAGAELNKGVTVEILRYAA